VLSEHEQRLWDDIEHWYALEAEEAAAEDLPGFVVVGVWVTILAVLFGAAAVGLAIGAATALGWALRRDRPREIGDPTARAPHVP
jgi:hypothetical protein